MPTTLRARPAARLRQHQGGVDQPRRQLAVVAEGSPRQPAAGGVCHTNPVWIWTERLPPLLVTVAYIQLTSTLPAVNSFSGAGAADADGVINLLRAISGIFLQVGQSVRGMRFRAGGSADGLYQAGQWRQRRCSRRCRTGEWQCIGQLPSRFQMLVAVATEIDCRCLRQLLRESLVADGAGRRRCEILQELTIPITAWSFGDLAGDRVIAPDAFRLHDDRGDAHQTGAGGEAYAGCPGIAAAGCRPIFCCSSRGVERLRHGCSPVIHVADLSSRIAPFQQATQLIADVVAKFIAHALGRSIIQRFWICRLTLASSKTRKHTILTAISRE